MRHVEVEIERNGRRIVAQGTYTPGTRIPILDPSVISQTKPDFILILPWNLREEIKEFMSHVEEWGCRFVVPIPSVEILE